MKQSQTQRFLIAGAVVLGLFAAGCAEKTLGCSDEHTLELVKSIYQNSLSESLATGAASQLKAQIDAATNVKVNSIRTVGKDDKVGKTSCEADFSIKVPLALAKALSTPGNLLGAAVQSMNLKVDYDRIEKSIEYTVQLTDDKAQAVVFARGLSDMGQLVAKLAQMGVLTPPSPEAQAPAVQAADPAPASVVQVEAAPAPTPPTVTVSSGGSAKSATVTRYGPVAITSDLRVLFQGKPLSPPIQGDNELEVSQKIEIGADDVLLLQQTGGTGCPAQFYFMRVTATGATATESFGTCSHSPKVARDGDAVRVTLSGFAANSQPIAEQEAADKEVHVFVYRNGAVAEEARPKQEAAAQSRPSFPCDGKLSPAERLICDTPSLAKADSNLAGAYAAALNKASDPVRLRQEQRDWRRTRDACSDANCMSGTYAKRQLELSR